MMPLHKYSSLALTVICLFAFSIRAVAQETKQPAQSVPQQPMVKFSVLVLDGKNYPVRDLSQDDFQVFEEDAPQKISLFSKEDVPEMYGLLVDCSGSMRTQLSSVIEAGRMLINANKPGDETFLVRFISSDKIEMAHDFTTDKTVLLDRLSSFAVEGGQTALLDALYYSADHLAKYKPEEDITHHRRALIFVSDGEERGSKFSKAEVIKLLRKLDIQVFAIGLVKDLQKEGGVTRLSPREKAVGLLEELSKETGGRALFPDSPSELRIVADEITRYLHTQYIIGYNPTSNANKDTYRKVHIKLTDAPGHNKLKVIVRSGYTVP